MHRVLNLRKGITMNPRELKEIIAEGESSVLEFKRKATTPNKLAREIAALANTKGGILIIGVDDDGTIVGVRSEKSEIDIVEQACVFHIFPPVQYEIEIIEYKDKDIILVHIPESKTKPHVVEIEDTEKKRMVKRAYIRLGEKSVIASKEMYKLMTSQANGKPLKISIGDRERRLFSYLEKHERITVKEFAAIVNISRRRAERILIDLVRANVIVIHNDTSNDYFSLAPNINLEE